jgi:DNA-binding transcriptional ArsR family regulator
MHDQLTSTFAALADPTRRAILARLAVGETSVTELARPFEMSMPAVSKHLKVLERAGLISRGREAQWRPCRLDAGPLKQAASWVEEYRRFWSGYVDALERHLDRMGPSTATKRKTRRRRRGPNRDRDKGETR